MHLLHLTGQPVKNAKQTLFSGQVAGDDSVCVCPSDQAWPGQNMLAIREQMCMCVYIYICMYV